MGAKGSVLKRVRQSVKANIRNKHYKTMMKTAIKKVESSNKKDASENLKNAISVIDKVASKRVIHKNKANNKKSQLAKHVNSL